jgi:hypothetical protein
MNWHGRRWVGAGLGLLLIGITGCSRRETVPGECGPVNGAEVCVWGEMSGKTILSFGATIPIQAIENAPDEAPMLWPPVAEAALTLPEAVSTATGFKHLTIVWEPHGHPPGPYLTPHFDFHFYSLSNAERDAIDCVDAGKPEQLPAAYELPDIEIPGLGLLPGLCVPKMGMHSLLGEELRSQDVFEKTLVVGYYHGQPIFVEPMIARAALTARRSFTLPIPEVPNRAAGSRYPTSFRADYDSTAQAYRFVFSDFTPAGGP